MVRRRPGIGCVVQGAGPHPCRPKATRHRLHFRAPTDGPWPRIRARFRHIHPGVRGLVAAPLDHACLFLFRGETKYRHHNSRRSSEGRPERSPGVRIRQLLRQTTDSRLACQQRWFDTDTTTSKNSRGSREGRLGPDERTNFRGVCKCLRKAVGRAIRRGMAFIVLRRSRNTRSYYLVESYRDDQGKTRRRTVCYTEAQRVFPSPIGE
jgi:hypothetical protein